MQRLNMLLDSEQVALIGMIVKAIDRKVNYKSHHSPPTTDMCQKAIDINPSRRVIAAV